MARIAGINIPQNKLVHIGLTYIYGIGDKFSQKICSSLEIPRAKRINELTYDDQLKDYIKNNLRINNYKVNFKETGAIPLFHPKNIKKLNQIEIGTAGGMTRLSTGYTFLNIQEQSQYIRQNLEKIRDTKLFSIKSKYQFLDKIFLKVLRNNPNKMPKIFYKMFNCSANTVINFLSNKSNIYEDISIISKMPKLIFLKQIF